VEFEHNGFFNGLKEHLQYVSVTLDIFDIAALIHSQLCGLKNFLSKEAKR
jgi:hypothetical protein